MPTNEERKKIATRLREVEQEYSTNDLIKRQTAVGHLSIISEAVDKPKGQTLWGRLADLIDPELDRMCVFTPDVYETRFSEDGEESDTNNPAPGCTAFICSECDGSMMYGENGWFETEPQYEPLFNYCPYCGAKVVPND